MIRTRKHFTKSALVLLSAFILLSVSPLSVQAQWTTVTPPTVSGSWYLNAVYFTSADEGWAVGEAYGSSDTRGVLLHYQSGVWTSVAPPTVSDNWYLNAVHFTSTDEGWAVGIDASSGVGSLLHYQSGTWTSVTPPTVSGYWDLYGVHFTSANEGWAVGQSITTKREGVLLHYQSGTWTSVTLPTVSDNWYLNAVHFTSADEGWAVGIDYETNSKGVLLHYQSGTWTSVAPPTVGDNWYLYGVRFTSADEGWAVGHNFFPSHRGVLLHYQSGTWTSVEPPTVSTSWYLEDVHFTSADEGWAVGYSSTGTRGVLLRYQSGTWASVTPPTVSNSWYLMGVYFPSAGEGWAVGHDSTNGRGVLFRYGAPPASAVLTVGKSGNGTGTVTSDPAGISCGSDCTETYDTGTVVTLTAAPDMDSTFTGWSGGGCSGTGTCEVTMNTDVTVTATFMLINSLPELSAAEGTIGTEITVSGTGFGIKKGKVLIGGVTTKVAKDGWTDTMITTTLTKVLTPGVAYDVTLMVQPYKTTAPVTLSGAFTVKNPELDPLVPDHGTPGTEITVTGRFFSTKKGKVYLEDPATGKKKTCKVTNWQMDPTNGESTLTFVVPMLPKGFSYGAAYPLKISNKVGADQTTFTVDPPAP